MFHCLSKVDFPQTSPLPGSPDESGPMKAPGLCPAILFSANPSQTSVGELGQRPPRARRQERSWPERLGCEGPPSGAEQPKCTRRSVRTWSPSRHRPGRPAHIWERFRPQGALRRGPAPAGAGDTAVRKPGLRAGKLAQEEFRSGRERVFLKKGGNPTSQVCRKSK